MQNSQKRTKFRIPNRFLGVFLGICLVITGCANHSPNNETDSVIPDVLDETVYPDYSGLLNSKVITTADTPVYRLDNGKLEECGVMKEKVILDIGEEQIKNSIHIKDTEFYIDGAGCTDSGRYYKNDNRLMAYPETLTTKSEYRLYDVHRHVVYTGSSSDEYRIYVQPIETDNRYGILFNNMIYYINADDVEKTAESGDGLMQTADSIPVLMYHFFYDESLGQTRKEGNYVEVNELDEHLTYLEDNGYIALTMREVEYFMEQRALVPVKSIAITIDDADDSVYDYGFKVFQKHDLKATLFVICGWQPGDMSYKLWEMREDGIELQSHGFLTHQSGCPNMGHGGRLLCMPYEDGVQDTIMSFEYTAGGFVYCYPFGDVNEHAKTIIRDAGAKLAFTTQHGKIDPSMDLLELPRIRVTGGNSLESFAASIR